MARLRGAATTQGEVALSGAVAKTILQLVAPSSQRVALLGFAVAFDGVSSTAEPVQVEILRQTSAGTSSAGTPVKDDDSITDALRTTSRITFTVEPTSGDVLRRYNVHPQTGFERVFGPDEEIIIGGSDRLGIRCTAPVGVNVTGHMIFEE